MAPTAAESLATALRRRVRGAIALGCVLFGLTAGFIAHERREFTREEFGRVTLLTTLLEQHVDSAFSDNDNALDAAAALLLEGDAPEADARAAARVSALLNDLFWGRASVRSVSVLAPDGRILSSSAAANVGGQIDTGLLGGLPEPGVHGALGQPLSGRDLAGARLAGADAPVELLPLLRTVMRPDGSRVLLVVLLNLDHFASRFAMATDGGELRATLLTPTASVLAASEHPAGPAPKPGAPLAAFGAAWSERESGATLAPGLDGVEAVQAFRKVRNWPLVVLAEVRESVVDQRILEIALPVVGLLLTLLVVIALAVVLAIRNLRRQAALSAGLDEALRLQAASDVRNRAVLESSIDAVLTIDEDSRIVAFNPAAERMFGHRADEVLGRDTSGLIFPPEDRAGNRALLRGFLTGELAASVERRMEFIALRADGTRFTVEASIAISSIEGRRYVTGTLQDITERKRAEAQVQDLLQTQSRLLGELNVQKRALDEHAIVSITDAEGRITYANPKLVERLGFGQWQMVGRGLHEFRLPLLSDDAYSRMRVAQQRLEVWHGELPFRDIQGRVLWFSSTIVPIPDADGKLRQTITIQTDITRRYQAEAALEQARARELDYGVRIQDSLLVPASTELSGCLELSGFMRSAHRINGDFYEVIGLGENMVDVIAGDVMGKGIPAALMGAAAKMHFSRSIAELMMLHPETASLPRPVDIVERVDRLFSPHLVSLEAFVTLSYLRVDGASGTVTWVGCGHEETLLIGADRSVRTLPNQHPPVGVLPHQSLVQDTVALQAGDALLLCSDGVTDAFTEDGERLGRERIEAAVLEAIDRWETPSMALHGLRRDLLSRAVITDDLMLLLIMRTDPARRLSRIELPMALDALDRLRDFVARHAEASGFDEMQAAAMTLAAVEVTTNAVRHATGRLENAPIEVIAEPFGESVELRFRYFADPFVPPEEPAEIDLSAFPEGGFGLHIIRQVCDEVEYRHDDGVNTVRIRLRRERPTEPDSPADDRQD